MSSETAYLITIGTGFTAGLVCYAISRYRTKAHWKLVPLMHSGGWGAAVAAGVHLLLCACLPEHLVYLVDAKTGTPVHVNGALFKMDVLHRIHIAIGGIGTVFLAAIPLRKACRDVSPRIDDDHG